VILGVLLAAGTGSRFETTSESSVEGETKLLADLDGQPLVAHAAKTLTESSLDAAVAVVGHEQTAVERALPEAIETVPNPDYEQGQSTSVRQGIAAARERDADAVLFALGDMPCLSHATVEAILDTYRGLGDDSEDPASERPASQRPTSKPSANEPSASEPPTSEPSASERLGIVAPRYDGQRGNPVLFDSRYFDSLTTVEGDRGGRDLLDSESVAWVEVSDPGIHRDVDTVADLRCLREGDDI
jgi:molybdenum cofactor cytidylyltransferase